MYVKFALGVEVNVKVGIALLIVNDTTDNIINNTLNNTIGSYTYVFNITGNANYTSKSLTSAFDKYVPVYLENASITHTLNNTPYTWNTFYPIKIYTLSPVSNINFTLSQGTTALQTGVLNISYIPPSTTASGNYVYTILEQQGTQSITPTLTLTLNSSSLKTQPCLTSTALQYFPLETGCISWNARPINFKINQHFNTTNNVVNIDEGSNTLLYGFNLTAYYPFINFTLTPNTGLTTNSFTLLPFKLITSTTTPNTPYTRKIDNITGYDEQTHKIITTNFTTTSTYLFYEYKVCWGLL